MSEHEEHDRQVHLECTDQSGHPNRVPLRTLHDRGDPENRPPEGAPDPMIGFVQDPNRSQGVKKKLRERGDSVPMADLGGNRFVVLRCPACRKGYRLWWSELPRLLDAHYAAQELAGSPFRPARAYYPDVSYWNVVLG